MEKICSSCGSKLRTNTKFCRKCGKTTKNGVTKTFYCLICGIEIRTNTKILPNF